MTHLTCLNPHGSPEPPQPETTSLLSYCRQSEEGDGKHGEAGCNSLPDPRLRHFVSVSDGGHCHLRREEAEMNRRNPILDAFETNADTEGLTTRRLRAPRGL